MFMSENPEGFLTSHSELATLHVKKQKFVLFETPEFENIWQVSCLATSEFFRCLGLCLLFHSCRTPALSEHHGGRDGVKDS